MLPGSDGPAENEEKALGYAREIGYPVIIKAVAGGAAGACASSEHRPICRTHFSTAQREAEAAFVSAMYIEKYLQNPRHIEFQVTGDHHGNLCTWANAMLNPAAPPEDHRGVAVDRPSTRSAARWAASLWTPRKPFVHTNAGTFEFLMDAEGSSTSWR